MRHIFLKECHVSVSMHACNEKSKGPGFDSWGMPLLFVPSTLFAHSQLLSAGPMQFNITTYLEHQSR